MEDARLPREAAGHLKNVEEVCLPFQSVSANEGSDFPWSGGGKRGDELLFI